MYSIDLVISRLSTPEVGLGVTHGIYGRQLVGVMDATKSTITGITENLPFIKGDTHTFVVTAKDSTGVDVGSGGEKVYIKVTDHCTRNTLMSCDDVLSSPSVLSSEIVALMWEMERTHTQLLTTTWEISQLRSC